MKWTRSVLTVAIVWVAGATLAAQNPPAKTPFENNPDAIRYGMGLFRSRCADCHGMDARGVRGPDLTQVWASGRTDEGLFRTVRRGIPGTEMRAIGVRAPDDEVWKVLAYLRTIASPTAGAVAGNAENGARIFRGVRGPDLTQVWAS